MKFLFIVSLLIASLQGNSFDKAVKLYQAKKYTQAYNSFKELANKNHPDAQYNLATMYLKGIGTKQNDVLAFVWYDISARNGNKLAQNKLGTLYESGAILNQKDLKKSIEYYKESALQNYPIAQYNLALTLNESYNEDKLKQALFWYKRASDNGNVAAMNNLANLYFNGQGVKKDLKKAYELYKKGSELNDGVSKFNLAMMYYQGDYVKQNDKKALKNLLESAMLGTPMAQVRLGKFYLKGGSLVNQDYKKALTWFYEAAKQKYPPGLHQMGVCYFYGYGIPANRKKAAFWFYQASDRGYEYSEKFIKKHNLYY